MTRYLSVLVVALASIGFAEEPTYLLRYKLTDGQRLNYEVTHVAKTKTRIQGKEEISQVHTLSKRHWQVADVVDEEVTFDQCRRLR